MLNAVSGANATVYNSIGIGAGVDGAMPSIHMKWNHFFSSGATHLIATDPRITKQHLEFEPGDSEDTNDGTSGDVLSVQTKWYHVFSVAGTHLMATGPTLATQHLESWTRDSVGAGVSNDVEMLLVHMK